MMINEDIPQEVAKAPQMKPPVVVQQHSYLYMGRPSHVKIQCRLKSSSMQDSCDECGDINPVVEIRRAASRNISVAKTSKTLDLLKKKNPT